MREVLEFERSWWQEPRTKGEGIRERFKISSTSYYRLLDRVIDTPDALRLDPLLVKRLRLKRTERRRRRLASVYGLRI